MTFPIVALAEGEVADPLWFEQITDAVNDHETRVDTLESQVNTSSVSNTDSTSRTTTSTSFTSTLSPANICGIAFTAPTSGKILVAFACDCDNGGAGFASATAAIRAGSVVGSGTSFLAAAFAQSITLYNGAQALAGRTRVVEGLTPGGSYNAYFEHQVDSGTGTFRFREMSVVPLIA